MKETQTANIRYETDAILKFFDGQRDKWEDFYPSEQWAFKRIAADNRALGTVFDCGCALGGLGLALSDQFKIKSYVGVDINPQAIARARADGGRFSVPVQFYCEDVLRLDHIDGEPFDVVVSLSCADWNIETNAIIERCWSAVKPGGYFVLTVRLTDKEGVNDMQKSRQEIIFANGEGSGEFANYVVFNVHEFLAMFKALKPKPSLIAGYGYWGKPASNAITDYEKLVFAGFVVQKKNISSPPVDTEVELNLPDDLFS